MELNTKIRQQVKSIFIAPVFKKKINKLGIYGFLKLSNFTNKKSTFLSIKREIETALRGRDTHGFSDHIFYFGL